MAINIRKLFAGVGLASGGGTFAPAPVPSGDLETTRALGGANLRRFDTLARAIDGETRALVEQGEAVTGLGESIQVGSHQIARSFTDLEQRRRQSRERHEAATARVQYLRDADTILQRSVAETDPAATDLVPRVRQALHDRTTKLLDGLQIDDEGLKASLEDQMAFISARTTLAARKIGIRQETGFLRGELDKRLAVTHHQALQHRGALQEQLIAVGISDVRDAGAEGLLDGATVEAKIAAFRTGITRGTIAADALSDPAGSLSRLEAGAYDHLFASDAERAAAAGAIGQSLTTQRVADVAKLDAVVDAHIASLRATGRRNPGLRATVAQLKPEALAQFDARVDRARLFADIAGRMRFVPRDEAEALVRDAAPMPDAEDFARQSRLHDAAREAWHERERALRDDPVAYAAGHPSVKSRADNIALQKVLGVRQPLEMSRSEVAGWRQELEGAAPEKAIELLGRFRNEFSQTGANQLSAALRDEQPALALAVHHVRSMPDVSKDVLDGLGVLSGKPELRPAEPDIEARLEEVFGNAFEFSEHLRRPVLEAAAAIYARTARDGTPFDARAFDAALRRIGGAVMDADGTTRGGPFEHRGRMIPPPRPGLGAAETDAAIGALTGEELEKYGNGLPLDVLQLPYTPEDIHEHGELIPLGMGRYMLRFDELGELDTGDTLDRLVGGEGDDGLSGGIGDDELLELANLLDDTGIEGDAPVDRVRDSAPSPNAAEEPEEAQVAGLGKILLGLITTSSGRAILRAIGRTVRGSRRKADETDDPLTDLAAGAARDATGRAIIDALEGGTPDVVSSDKDGKDQAVDEDDAAELRREIEKWRVRSKGKGVEVASNVRPLRPEDFVQLPEAKFLKGLDGSPNLGAVPGFSGAPHGGKELPIRVARRRLRHSNSPKKLADASAVGFLDGTELVQFVAENYSQVREIEDGLAIVWRNGKGVTVFVRLQRSQDGGYYTVTSSGIRSNEQIDRWKLLWSRTPTPDSTAG